MEGERRLRDYFRPHLGRFLLGIALTVLSQLLQLGIPGFMKRVTDAMLASSFQDARVWGAGVLALAVLSILVRIFARISVFHVGRLVEQRLQSDLFDALLRLAPSFYLQMPAGQVMSRAVNDLTSIRLMLGFGILNVVGTAVTYLVVVPSLLAVDLEIALASLAPLLLLAVLFSLTSRRVLEGSRLVQEQIGQLSTRLQQNLAGVATIRSYSREAAEIESFREINDRCYEAQLVLAKQRSLLQPATAGFTSLTMLVLFALGGTRVIEGRFTIGQFVAFSAYLATLAWPTTALGWMFSVWQRGLAAMERVNELFRLRPTLLDGPVQDGFGPRRLEVRDLTFRYREGGPPVLSGVSATFEPGSTVVIVGRTGSGKSTLLRALCRLLEIPRGTVYLDGVDVSDLPLATVRGAVSYAPQDAFLFSRPIHENIAFGRPDAGEEEVRVAAERAGLAPDLESFPERLETMIGERGVTLSGGQRQRTALARALILEAPILILDDALSAVDTVTEQRILAELARRRGRATTIMVTHRLAYADVADCVLVIEEGRVVERGTAAELMARGGIYFEMHRRQRLRDSIDARAQGANGRREVEA